MSNMMKVRKPDTYQFTTYPLLFDCKWFYFYSR